MDDVYVITSKHLLITYITRWLYGMAFMLSIRSVPILHTRAVYMSVYLSIYNRQD